MLLRFLPLLMVCTLVHSAEPADAYPSRPVSIIVPFAPGGGLDVSARLVAKYAGPELGQALEVVNKTRGGNLAGNVEGIAAEPDGYVLLAWGSGLVTDELVIRAADYSHRDVAPICLYADDPHIIVVEADFARDHGIASLDDLLRHVRANPGQVTLGVGGNWTTHDLLRLRLETAAGAAFNRMPFLGGSPAVKAATEGNCNVALPFVSELMPFLDSGRVIPLAVTYQDRAPQLPDVPTIYELGHPDLHQTIWRVFTAPKGTPREVVRRLEEAFRKALLNDDLRREALELGVNPLFMNSDRVWQFIEREYGYYAEKTREWGVRVR